jgi:hypothetical protein
MPFLQDNLAVRTSDGLHSVSLEPLQYQTNAGVVITAPTGSDSDGASVPHLFHALGFTPFGPWWLAARLHDYLYRKTYLPREYCDDILNESMESLVVADVKRMAIYNAVRAFGEMAFDKDRKILESDK